MLCRYRHVLNTSWYTFDNWKKGKITANLENTKKWFRNSQKDNFNPSFKQLKRVGVLTRLIPMPLMGAYVNKLVCFENTVARNTFVLQYLLISWFWLLLSNSINILRLVIVLVATFLMMFPTRTRKLVRKCEALL